VTKSGFVRRLGLGARLLALGGTAYFLIATSSYPPPSTTPQNSGQQTCYHAAETLIFHVTGTCGAEGNITVMSDVDDCAIAVQGAGSVGLPSAGRFDVTSAGTVSLSESAWKISGYLPETVTTGTGPFTIVGSDAGGVTGSTSVAGQSTSHGKLVSRSCTYQSIKPSLSCMDDYALGCQAILTPQ